MESEFHYEINLGSDEYTGTTLSENIKVDGSSHIIELFDGNDQIELYSDLVYGKNSYAVNVGDLDALGTNLAISPRKTRILLNS